MSTGITAATTVIAVVLAATAGYRYRRREHLRERRLDAYREVLAAFLAAARTAAMMISLHLMIGWPHQITSSHPQRDALYKAHGDAFERAAANRQAFEVAAFGAELVAGHQMRVEVERLRRFLLEAAYSGSPWKSGGGGDGIASMSGLEPSVIEEKALEAATPFVRLASRELWRRLSPDSPRRWWRLTRGPAPTAGT